MANRFDLLAKAALMGALVGCSGTAASVGKSNNRLDLAKDFLSKHDLEPAEAEATKAIRFNSRNAEAFNIRGLVSLVRAFDFKRLGEVDACLTGVDAEAIRSDQETSFKKAIDDFTRATEIAPDYGEAWSNHGVVLTLTGNPEDAADMLRHALEFPVRLDNPGLTRANLAWALFQQHAYVPAAKELRQAIQFQPGMCVASYRLGRVYFAREEWEDAAERFQTVVDDRDCGSQEARLFLMKTRIQQGLLEDARTARDACLAMAPNSCDAVECRTAGAKLGTRSDKQSVTPP